MEDSSGLEIVQRAVGFQHLGDGQRRLQAQVID